MICQAISQWVVQVQVLFTQRRAFTIPGTWAHGMFTKLSKPTLFSVGKDVLQIGWAGPPPQHVLEHCYEMMDAWVVMAISVVRAEFPPWSLLQSFCIFSTDASRSNASKLLGLELGNCIPRLARVFNVRAVNLTRQFEAPPLVSDNLNNNKDLIMTTE